MDRTIIDPVSDCWLWTKRVTDNGYGQSGNGKLAKKHATLVAHKLSYLAFGGVIPDGMLLRHTCRNRHCCNPKHLEVGTHQDNMDDKYRDGTNPGNLIATNRMLSIGRKGNKNIRAKLTNEHVIEIRRLHSTGQYILRELGNMFNVSLSQIANIVNRKQWPHL